MSAEQVSLPPFPAERDSRTILCLDPGFAATGYLVVGRNDFLQAHGVVKTEKSNRKLKIRAAEDDARRSAELARQLADLIVRHHCRGIVTELPHGGAQSARAMAHMARCAAIVVTVAELIALPIEYYAPEEVKRALTGRKRASKEEMIVAAAQHLPVLSELPKSKAEHIADAVGVWQAAKHGNLFRSW